MRKVLLFLLILLLLLVAVGGVLYYRLTTTEGRQWLDRTVRERIEGTMHQAVVPGYHFTMDSLMTDLRSGDVHITGIELRFDSSLVDDLRAGTYDYLFAARTRAVTLQGLSIWRAVLLRELRIRSVVVEQPSLQYVVRNKRVRLDAPLKRLPTSSARPVHLFRFEHVEVNGADAVMLDVDGRLPSMRASGLHVQAGPVRISKRGPDRTDLAMGPVDLRFDSLSTVIDGGYRLHIGPTFLSDHRRHGSITDIRLTPNTAVPPTIRTTVLDIRVDSLLLDAPALADLFADQALRVHKLSVHGMRLDAALDKALPEGPARPVTLPGQALLELPFDVAIDSLVLQRSSITYHESSDATGKWADITFNRLSAAFSGVSNTMDHLRDAPTIDGAIHCTFMDTAALMAQYHVQLDPSQRFHFEATVQHLPFHALNNVTGPLLRLELLGGDLRRMHLTMNGNDRKAHGTMDLDYAGLLTTVARDATNAQRHQLFGSVMDHVMAADSGAGLSDHRKRNYSILRDPDRSMFTYIWHFTREGLQRGLRPGVKERITSLLRKEREERRRRRDAHKH